MKPLGFPAVLPRGAVCGGLKAGGRGQQLPGTTHPESFSSTSSSAAKHQSCEKNSCWAEEWGPQPRLDRGPQPFGEGGLTQS